MRFQIPLARQMAAAGLCGLLVWTTTWASLPDVAQTPVLSDMFKEPYLELLERADEFYFPERQLEELRKQLKREEKSEKKRLKQEEKGLETQIKQLRGRLSDLNQASSRDSSEARIERHDIHCTIQSLEKKLNSKQTERKNSIPLAYDNKQAKLDLIELWPLKKQEIEEALELGQARERRFGDVEDIGIRVLKEGQEKDIRVGEEAVREMRASGLVPPEVEDEELNTYVRQLAQKIASHSDLKVPLNITLLASEEVNAFALPGGFLFVNTGLIDKAETESELVGVIAHEIAHVTARHGARLMKKASIANILYQAAQVAAIVLTGGVLGAGAYYAMQYGFMGLGMALNLTLLGVSRDYEEEADQLGAQYAWKAGYDPKGFISFFDKLATEKGFVQSASFFRTHPPFFERILSTFSEITYLPAKTDLVYDSTEFLRAKERLQVVNDTHQVTIRERPTLTRGPQCEDGNASQTGSVGS